MSQADKDAARAKRIADLKSRADRHGKRVRELEHRIFRRLKDMDAVALQDLQREHAREKEEYEKASRALGRFGPRKQKRESRQLELCK